MPDSPALLGPEPADAPPVAVLAVLRRPLRFLGSWWPWRSWAYLGSGFLIGYPVLVVLALLVGLGVALAPVGIGLLLLTGAVLAAVPLGTLERRRLRCVEPLPVAGQAHRRKGLPSAGAAGRDASRGRGVTFRDAAVRSRPTPPC
ncbi:sensor domain-containing protein [Streptomyces sp. NPDC097617]|uniref:sensor domain-containing protein n=1 Tax=Streptomyces sp. NPDC097617 TaxID=3366091 RepID=UPI0037F3547A